MRTTAHFPPIGVTILPILYYSQRCFSVPERAFRTPGWSFTAGGAVGAGAFVASGFVHIFNFLASWPGKYAWLGKGGRHPPLQNSL